MSHNETEFAEFFEASWDPCLRTVAASTGSLLAAEDQVAEAFARAWVSWPKVSAHSAPRAWVVRTALNAGASWWRRRGREVPLADRDVAARGTPGAGLDTTLLTAMRRLPARQREVITCSRRSFSRHSARLTIWPCGPRSPASRRWPGGRSGPTRLWCSGSPSP